MKKKFKMFDAILTVICVVFVAEAAAPVAAIGNCQFFYWILLMFTFLLPYGLIACELGTTYQSEGGLYDWVRKAFGNRWGSRTAWFYWVNFPLWMASLAVMTPELLSFMFGIEFSPIVSILLQLLFIWIIVGISLFPVSDSVWILNIAAIIKVFLAVVLGVLGIYRAMTSGLANEITISSLFPQGIEGLSYISVVLFNFLGFEVICTFADSMENPKRQIPRAIIFGGIAIMAVYLFSSFGIGAGIPASQIDTSSGLIEALQVLTGQPMSLFISIMAGLFLITLFGNMISWSLGVNNVAAYAADNGDMPRLFAKRNPKNNMPVGASVINGVVASVIVIAAPFIPNQDLFWSFFSLNLFAFLVSYLPMFPAFLKLRKVDADTPRGYRAPGGPLMLKIMAYLPFLEILLCLVFVVLPLSFDTETLMATLPITFGAVLIVLIEEILIRVRAHKIKHI